MFVDVEETLSRELREVADGLTVPAMPPLPQAPPRVARPWQPLLVAASVALVVAGAVVAVATARGGQEPAPAPPQPSPTRSVGTLPRTAPTIPYVVDQRLYVAGEQVPGTWWSVRGDDAGWLALRTDSTWWWGRGPEPHEITGPHDVPPVVSPDGRYVAEVGAQDGQGALTAFDTASGESLGGVPLDLGDPQDGSTVSVRAVTDDGRVVVQGTDTSLLWLPLEGGATVDLGETAPEQQFLAGTPTGLVVTDGAGGVVDGTIGEPYLAEISETGELTRTGAVPTHDDVLVSPGGAWLTWTAPGTTGGEVTSVAELRARSVDGGQQVTLTAPAGWGFRTRAWAWESDEHLVSPVVGDGGDERMARCSVQLGRCVLVDTR
jgi:hypothetical protein